MVRHRIGCPEQRPKIETPPYNRKWRSSIYISHGFSFFFLFIFFFILFLFFFILSLLLDYKLYDLDCDLSSNENRFYVIRLFVQNKELNQKKKNGKKHGSHINTWIGLNYIGLYNTFII